MYRLLSVAEVQFVRRMTGEIVRVSLCVHCIWRTGLLEEGIECNAGWIGGVGGREDVWQSPNHTRKENHG